MIWDAYIWIWAHPWEVVTLLWALVIGYWIGYRHAKKIAKKAHRQCVRAAVKEQYRRDHAWQEVG